MGEEEKNEQKGKKRKIKISILLMWWNSTKRTVELGAGWVDRKENQRQIGKNLSFEKQNKT